MRVHKVDLLPKLIKPDKILQTKILDMESPDYWFIKGYEHAKNNEMDSAIDSYRQSIRLDTSNHKAMINIAAQYEHQQKYDLSCKWYKLSILISPDILEAYFGFALSAFKDGRPQDGVTHLDIAIEKLGGEELADRTKSHLIIYRYLRSLCYRVMGNFKKSQ